jgi:hypothetical protein
VEGGEDPSCLLLSIYWGCRGGSWHSVTTDEVLIESDKETGVRYLVWNPILDKNHGGGTSADVSQDHLAMENLSNPNNCPIALFQKAINLRPRPVEGKPFKCFNKLFLQALKTRRAEQWFGGQPHSKKTIGTWMTMLCEEACIEPRTNHCGRRSFCTRLVSIVEDLQQVTQFTGHKNVNSLKAYTAFAGERLRSVHEQLRGDGPSQKDRE